MTFEVIPNSICTRCPSSAWLLNAGVHELVLRDPMRIYHIEHGSGWTPEGHARLFAGLTESGIGFLEYPEVIKWTAQMRRLKSPMIFNPGNWGLADSHFRSNAKTTC